jgi:hypothetical protein
MTLRFTNGTDTAEREAKKHDAARVTDSTHFIEIDVQCGR